MNTQRLMNLQGMTFTEQQARDFYGSRFETAQLVWATFDEDGQLVEDSEHALPAAGSPGTPPG